ncbi:ACT domain-containing protein [Nakamurella sp. YIM 132087]|uniref:Dihydrofolate reductase n=1 Tax=Nakamurella alba TaxID=2665158 RepID=A0A7K1FIL5_9ACTN|nr:ACT domain-containing protein [Nakamurella alba]MTD13967.1 ACT domain-containing protein [Nakamurella alba]
MTITLVAAVAHGGVIGADGGMPWHLPEDLRRFKALTMGRPMIMGRRTFESIGRPLPGRRSIVVTRDGDWAADGVEVAHSLGEALELARAGGSDDVMVVGGGDIYAQALPLADVLEITHIDRTVAGDTRFPEIGPAEWEPVAELDAGPELRFTTYRRRPPALTDLQALLHGMSPVRRPDDVLFCTVAPGTDVPAGLSAVATVREAEGTTLVLTVADAAAAGLAGVGPQAWISLQVHSDLDAVGLTAAVAGALARHALPCNVIAGYFHDHLFVPADRADEALSVLAALAHTA